MARRHGIESGTPVKSGNTPGAVGMVVACLVFVIVAMFVGIAMYIYTTAPRASSTSSTTELPAATSPLACPIPEEPDIERIDLAANETRLVTSPCFPAEDDLPPGVTTLLVAPDGYRVKASFKEFRFDDLNLNRLLIGYGESPHAFGTTISLFGGYDLPPDLVSPNNAMWMEMYGPYGVVNGAYMAEISVVTDADVNLECTGTDQPCRYALKCFTEKEHCNGDYECPSATDEIGCECLVSRDYKCADGMCINRNRLCDAFPSCNNDHLDCSFSCPEGFNISSELVCDGVNDCGDFADEMQNCTCDLEDQYLCPGGECIYAYNVCDGFVHCSDGADERNCTCQSWQFECVNSGDCIPFWERCDGNNTCGDNSDEANCPECSENYLACPNHLCFPESLRCNGFIDCYDGEDEQDCPSPEPCEEGEFTCNDGTCLRSSLRCDEVPQCNDGEDEDSELCGADVDEENCFFCNDGTCIPLDWYCDGYDDCDEREDEEGCPEDECEEGFSVCANRSCIGNEYICNGIVDCPGGADETCTDAPNACDSMSSSDYFVCDGKEDCPGGADEQNCACGDRPVTMSRILAGRQPSKGEWPWQIIIVGTNSTEFPICGGTIINRRWVLTAAHCVTPFSIRTRYVIAGVTDLDAEDTATWQNRLVYDIVWNPGFDLSEDSFVQNDNALLLLDRPLDFNDYVQPACLPDVDFQLDPGTYATATGWGETGGGRSPRQLQENRLPVWPTSICDRFHYMNYEQTQRIVCVGYERGILGLCFGDSGGPLVVESTGKWYVVGSVSGGIECGAPFIPSLFMRVSYYREWIDDTINLVY